MSFSKFVHDRLNDETTESAEPTLQLQIQHLFSGKFYSYSCYFPEIRIVIVATRMAGKADLTSHAKSVHLCK